MVARMEFISLCVLIATIAMGLIYDTAGSSTGLSSSSVSGQRSQCDIRVRAPIPCASNLFLGRSGEKETHSLFRIVWSVSRTCFDHRGGLALRSRSRCGSA